MTLHGRCETLCRPNQPKLTVWFLVFPVAGASFASVAFAAGSLVFTISHRWRRVYQWGWGSLLSAVLAFVLSIIAVLIVARLPLSLLQEMTEVPIAGDVSRRAFALGRTISNCMNCLALPLLCQPVVIALWVNALRKLRASGHARPSP